MLPIAGSLYDDLVAGIGQSVQGTIAEDGVIKESQPLFYRTVTGDGETRLAVSGNDEFVEIGRLLGGKLLKAEIVQNKQARGQVGAECLLQGAVNSGLRY